LSNTPNRLFGPARAVVFDLDGTLIDSARDIANAVNHTLARARLPELPLERVKSFVGDGARTLLSRASGFAEADARLEALLADFLEYYNVHATAFTRPLPGAKEALVALEARLPLALATNKLRPSTEAVLAALDLARHFRVVVAGGDPPRPKPSAEPLVYVARELGVQTAELVMVGDGPQDVLSGRAAGARAVAIRGGMASDERLLAAEPDAVLASLVELPALIERWATADPR
jgi:phosphoglycolate phosphatase